MVGTWNTRNQQADSSQDSSAQDTSFPYLVSSMIYKMFVN